MKFSERNGAAELRNALQIGTMDLSLRNGLWSVLYESFLSQGIPNQTTITATHYRLWKAIWRDFLKHPVDTLPSGFARAQSQLREWYFAAAWHTVYDFLEFVAQAEVVNDGLRQRFAIAINRILKRELSGYTLVDGIVVPISNEEELSAISSALTGGSATRLAVSTHLKAAIVLFSHKDAPDYRNSIKESISAVESIAKSLAGDSNAELGRALKALEGRVEIHPALDKGFRSLYGYTSNADGIRHAMLEASTVDAEDAQYMLVSCSAFINYLRAKARKAGLPE